MGQIELYAERRARWLRVVKTRDGKDEVDWMLEKIRSEMNKLGWSTAGNIMVTGSSALQVWFKADQEQTRKLANGLRTGLPEARMHLKTANDKYVLEPDARVRFVRPEGVEVPEGLQNKIVWILADIKRSWNNREVERILKGWPLDKWEKQGPRVEVTMKNEEDVGKLWRGG